MTSVGEPGVEDTPSFLNDYEEKPLVHDDIERQPKGRVRYSAYTGDKKQRAKASEFGGSSATSPAAPVRKYYPNVQYTCHICSDCRTAGQPVACPKPVGKNASATVTPRSPQSLQQQREAIVGCAKVVIKYPNKRQTVRKHCLENGQTNYCAASIVHTLTSVVADYHCCFDSLCNAADLLRAPLTRTLWTTAMLGAGHLLGLWLVAL